MLQNILTLSSGVRHTRVCLMLQAPFLFILVTLSPNIDVAQDTLTLPSSIDVRKQKKNAIMASSDIDST